MVSVMMVTIKITDRGSGVSLRPMGSSNYSLAYVSSTEISKGMIIGEKFISRKLTSSSALLPFFHTHHRPRAVWSRNYQGQLLTVPGNSQVGRKPSSSGIVFPSASHLAMLRRKQLFRYLHVLSLPPFFRIISWIYCS